MKPDVTDLTFNRALAIYTQAYQYTEAGGKKVKPAVATCYRSIDSVSRNIKKRTSKKMYKTSYLLRRLKRGKKFF